MAFAEAYQRQVALLVRLLPEIAKEECFALKGGTAINLFVRDLPRLSVDIDLTYLPVGARAASLAAIDAALKRIAIRIGKVLPAARVTKAGTEDATTKLTIRLQSAQVTIEVTPVLRGCVFEPAIHPVTAAVEDAFGFAEARLVSFADLYGGKLVAAFDRQHPRDLFDVRDLLANEGITDDLRRAFLVYLISHGRPMAEVLRMNPKNIEDAHARGFAGMTREPVTLEELLNTRTRMKQAIVGDMPAAHRRFLMSFERGAPDWSLLDLPEAAELPAVRWREENLSKIAPEKRESLVAELERVLANSSA